MSLLLFRLRPVTKFLSPKLLGAFKALNKSKNYIPQTPVPVPHNISSLSCRHRHDVFKFLYEMDTIYFRKRSQTEDVQINFHYVNANLQLDRVFNLQRSLGETLGSCLGRIQANLEKELKKKRGRKKKSPEADSVPIDAEYVGLVQLLRDDQPLDGQTLLEDVMGSCPPVGPSDLLMDIFGITFRVSCNLPWVNQIGLPASIMSGYYVYPSKLDMDCAELRDCDFLWFKVVHFGIMNLFEIVAKHSFL